MVVTDPTIDPITGLPLLNPQDVIQQIPLGVQTFPYEDMQATARPTRNPMYGDDILPVSAFVAGQHPSTGSAQTVETDGAHALLVKNVGGSSGGLSPHDLIGPAGVDNQTLPAGARTQVMDKAVGSAGPVVVTGLYGYVACPATSISSVTDVVIAYFFAHDGYVSVPGFAILTALDANTYGVAWSDQFTVPILFTDPTDHMICEIKVGDGGDMIGNMGFSFYRVTA